MSFDGEVRARLEVDAKEIIARYPRSRSALLPLLHLVQAEEGYVSSDGIEFCADLLDVTTAEVAGVATFYTMYKRRPSGDYSVGVCTNTLCAIMGGDQIFATLKDHLGVGHDETTDDGKVTLEHLECNAACDYAPVVMVNWEFFDNQTPDSAVELVDRLRDGQEVRPTRGPRLGTFKQISRVLAGFPDGLAGEGPAAGPATLLGLQLFRAQQAEEAQQAQQAQHAEDESPAKAAPKKTARKATRTTGTKTAKRSPGKAVPSSGTGYGREGGPSGSDAPSSTSQSDSAHPAEPGAEASTAAGADRDDEETGA